LDITQGDPLTIINVRDFQLIFNSQSLTCLYYSLRSVQMKLYSMNKREFALVFVAFFGLYACAVIIGVAGPPITATMHRSARHDLRLEAAGSAASAAARSNDSSSPVGDGMTAVVTNTPSHRGDGADLNSTGPYLLHTPYLSSYNRQLWLLAKIRVKNRQGK
jgi:hypothetical protein